STGGCWTRPVHFGYTLKRHRTSIARWVRGLQPEEVLCEVVLLSPPLSGRLAAAGAARPAGPGSGGNGAAGGSRRGFGGGRLLARRKSRLVLRLRLHPQNLGA